MAYPTDEIADCAEGNWDRITLTEVPSIGERILVRGLKLGNPARKASVGKYLATIKTVTNPFADKQAQGETGDVWDVMGCAWNDKYPGFVQTLKLVAKQSAAEGEPTLPATGWNDEVVRDGTTTSEDLYAKTQEKNYFDQSTVPDVTLQETGIIRVVQAVIDQMRRWRVSITTKTSKYSLVVFSVKERLNGGTQWHYVCRNQRGTAPDFSVLGANTTHAAPEAAGMVRDFLGTPTRNDDETWNWHIVYRQDPVSLTALGADGEKAITKYSVVFHVAMRSMSPSSNYYKQSWWMGRQLAHTVYYRIYADAASAWAATRDIALLDEDGNPITDNAGNPIILSSTKIGAPPQQLGDGMWQVHFENTSTVAWWWDRLEHDYWADQQ